MIYYFAFSDRFSFSTNYCLECFFSLCANTRWIRDSASASDTVGLLHSRQHVAWRCMGWPSVVFDNTSKPSTSSMSDPSSFAMIHRNPYTVLESASQPPLSSISSKFNFQYRLLHRLPQASSALNQLRVMKWQWKITKEIEWYKKNGDMCIDRPSYITMRWRRSFPARVSKVIKPLTQ